MFEFPFCEQKKMSLLETFLVMPEQGIFVQLTKQDLLELAKQYNLFSVKSSFKKQHIVNIIVEHLISENIFDESTSILLKKMRQMFLN